MSNPSCLDGPACRYVNSVVAVASQYWPDVCLSSCSAPVRSHHQLGSPATEEESVAQRSGKRADLKMDTLIFLTVVTAATSQAFVMFNYNRGRKYLAVCQQSLQTNISALNQWILIPSQAWKGTSLNYWIVTCLPIKNIKKIILPLCSVCFKQLKYTNKR